MEMIVQIGPQHLALAEPERFKVHTEGEKVVDVEVAVGYNHRGIEKLAERKTFEQDILLVERVCGICSMSHPVAFVQAVEDIAGVDVPERANYTRMIIEEMERIHSHLLWAGIAAEIIGIETLFMYIWKDREYVLDQLEIITGNRNHYAWNTIGGCRKDITEKHFPTLLTAVDIVERRTEYYIDAFLRNRTIRARLDGTGVLPKEDAKKLCTVGPTVRASGYAVDVRKDDPHLAYDKVDFEEIVLDKGDNMERAKVRLLEIIESAKIIEQAVRALKELPEGDIKVPVKQVPPGESVGRYEAPRGEVFHYVKSNGTFYPERVKIRAPTYGLSFAGDLIVVIYVLNMSAIMLALGGFASGSPFGAVGGSREITQLFAYELPLAISMVAVAVKAGSFSLVGIAVKYFVVVSLAVILFFWKNWWQFLFTGLLLWLLFIFVKIISARLRTDQSFVFYWQYMSVLALIDLVRVVI